MDCSKMLIFTVGIIFFVITDGAVSLKCYSCGTIDPKCRDPFDKDKEGIYSFDCSGSCYKAKSQNGDITRGCWPRPMEKKCTDQYVADRHGIDGPGTACHCSDNFCNGASTQTGQCIITTLLLLMCSMTKHYLSRP
ncbi:hypothetical protein CHS0354_000269 [Potamilus streckersoni]|uniref:Protein quiver n=1 Tax=Potamilus streckersoni TaxID=2493646 RepID=A0AAE0RYK5_9BIVA|nr:hypothetical protein CHS0354_000269 [Potamilus streckersoni]